MRVDAKVVELAAYRAGPGEPYVRVGTAADVPGAVALARSRHEASRLACMPWNEAKAVALFASAVGADERLLLVAVHDDEIIGSFLGMAAPYFLADGAVATDLDLSIADSWRRGALPRRLLRGYVAWAKALEVSVIQCGNTTITDRDGLSAHFALEGFRPAGNVFQYRGD